jgi:hypothetical protein
VGEGVKGDESVRRTFVVENGEDVGKRVSSQSVGVCAKA